MKIISLETSVDLAFKPKMPVCRTTTNAVSTYPAKLNIISIVGPTEDRKGLLPPKTTFGHRKGLRYGVLCYNTYIK